MHKLSVDDLCSIFHAVLMLLQMSDLLKVVSILILYKMVILALYTFEVCDYVLSKHQMIKILYLYSQFLKIT